MKSTPSQGECGNSTQTIPVVTTEPRLLELRVAALFAAPLFNNNIKSKLDSEMIALIASSLNLTTNVRSGIFRNMQLQGGIKINGKHLGYGYPNAISEDFNYAG